MRFLIKESQNKLFIQMLRRIPYFEKSLNIMIESDYPCYYDSKEDYIDILVTEAFGEVFDYDEDSEEQLKVISFLNKQYSQKLSQVYDDARCNE